MKTSLSTLLLATALAAACGKSSKSKDTPASGSNSDATGLIALTVGTPASFRGSATASPNQLEAPYKSELFEMFRFSLDGTTQLKAEVSDVSWGDGCGKVGAPWVAYGVADANEMTALSDGETRFPTTLDAGKYDLLINFVTENPCTLNGAKLTVSVDTSSAVTDGKPQPADPVVTPLPDAGQGAQTPAAPDQPVAIPDTGSAPQQPDLPSQPTQPDTGSSTTAPIPDELPGPALGTLTVGQALTLQLGASEPAGSEDFQYLESAELALTSAQAGKVVFDALTLTLDAACGPVGAVTSTVAFADGTTKAVKPGDTVDVPAGKSTWTIGRKSEHLCAVSATIKLSAYVAPKPLAYMNFLSQGGEYWGAVDTMYCQNKLRIRGAIVEVYNDNGTRCNGTTIPSRFYKCRDFEDLCEKCTDSTCASSSTYDAMRVCANGDVTFGSDNYRRYLGGYSTWNRSTQTCSYTVPLQPMPRQQVDQYLTLDSMHFWSATTWSQTPSGASYRSAEINQTLTTYFTMNEKRSSLDKPYPDGHLVVTDDVDFKVLTDNVAGTLTRTVTKITSNGSQPSLKVGDVQNCTYEKYYYAVDRYKLHCYAAGLDADFQLSR